MSTISSHGILDAILRVEDKKVECTLKYLEYCENIIRTDVSVTNNIFISYKRLCIGINIQYIYNNDI